MQKTECIKKGQGLTVACHESSIMLGILLFKGQIFVDLTVMFLKQFLEDIVWCDIHIKSDWTTTDNLFYDVACREDGQQWKVSTNSNEKLCWRWSYSG